jgi:Flp pilus assembly protein TadD
MSKIFDFRIGRCLACCGVLGASIFLSSPVAYAQYVTPPTPGHKCVNCPDSNSSGTPIERNDGRGNGSNESPAEMERRRAFDSGLEASNAGRWSAAEAYFTRAIMLGPTAATYANLALAILKQGRYAEAEVYYREAFRLDKNSNARYGLAEALNRLGIDLDKQGRLAEAEAKFRESLALDPKNGDRYHNLGFILEKQERYQEAGAAYRKALKLNPGDTLSQNALAAMPANKVQAEFRARFRASSDKEKHMKLGKDLIANGQVQEGIREYAEASRLFPDNHRIYMELGDELDRSHHLAEAETAYREAEKRAPDSEWHAILLTRIGEMREYQGDLLSAYSQFRKTESYPTDNSDINWKFARFLSNQTDYEAAVVYLRRALDQEHGNSDFLRGELREAEKALVQDTATAQLRVADQMGRVARTANSPEAAAATSQVPFDNGSAGVGSSRPRVVGTQGAMSQEARVPQERRTLTIAILETKWDAVRVERASFVKQLDELGTAPPSPDRDVKIAEVKQNISTAESKEAFFNFRINEEIQKPPQKQPERAPENPPQT